MLASVATAAWTGTLEALSAESIKRARDVIDLVIGLVGPMILFLGVVRIASEAGLLAAIVRSVRPLLRRLFPDVPEGHPALGAMVMNLSANVLGLGNAATPLGLKAMVELNKLNRFPGVATDSMALFLAINATSVTLMIPSGVIAIRAQYSGETGDAWAGLIWAATLIATTCSTVAAVVAALLLKRLPFFAARPLDDALVPPPPDDLPEATLPGAVASGRPIERWLVRALCLVLVAGLARELWLGASDPSALGERVMKGWPLPLLLFSLVAYGIAKGARAYEIAVEGGREALGVATRIAPYMVMMLVAIGMFSASGALAAVIGWLQPVTAPLGVPGNVLPLMLMKPLSGSGALAVLTDTLRSEGSYTYAGFLASAVNGSTETTFYVLTLYLGVIGVKNSRYILPACLIGDVAGYTGAVIATKLLCPASM
jgi:spore maturation protein SpmA/spore maturation protein SpmB